MVRGSGGGGFGRAFAFLRVAPFSVSRLELLVIFLLLQNRFNSIPTYSTSFSFSVLFLILDVFSIIIVTVGV